MNLEGKKIKFRTHERINELEKEHDIKLSAIQKVLLSSRGPSSSPLTAIYGNMNLFVLNQKIKPATKKAAEILEINEGDDVLKREVLAHKNGRPLIYGLTYIPTSRCRDNILTELLEEKITTSDIISQNDIETLRKVNKIYLEKPTAMMMELFKTDADFLSRDYILIQHGKIRMWAKESYPITYFKDF